MRGLRDQLRHIQKLLRRRGANPQDAEDLVQEAVVRLFVYTRKSGEVRNAEAFLTRTALNLAVDLHRSARRDRFEPEPVEFMELLDIGPTPDEVLAVVASSTWLGKESTTALAFNRTRAAQVIS